MYFFFFKQKTAYEMRISDWSSDVCSSDLRTPSGTRIMSLSVALFNALSGLQVNQTALQVTASNVANVNTPDYARKVHDQQNRLLGGMGAGVETAQIGRAHV